MQNCACVKEKATPCAKRTNRFAQGVAALTCSNLLVKILGMLFKIPLTNLVGEEGMAYYNLAYNIFKWFYMISTAGLPVAVSILIARCRAMRQARQLAATDRVATFSLTVIGAVGCAVMILFSGAFADLQGAPDAKGCMLFIAPSLFFICVSSALRGYFQGFEELMPTAVSQVIEAGCKLGLGMLFALYALRVRQLPLYAVAAWAIGGSTVGTALSMLYLIGKKAHLRPALQPAARSRERRDRYRTIAQGLAKIALPITLCASVMSLTDLIDSVLIINRLTGAAGVSHELALRQYGNYTSLAVPMYNLPLALIYPMCTAVVPALSAARASGDKEKLRAILNRTFQNVTLLAMPATLGLCVLSYPVLALLYRPAMAQTGAPLLSVLSLSVFFVAILSVTNAALQATGHEKLPIISMLIGAGVKIVSSSILTAHPEIGILGAPMSTSLCYFVIMLLNFRFVLKYTGVALSVSRIFFRPFCAAVGCAVCAAGSYRVLLHFAPKAVSTLLAIFVAVMVYALAVISLMPGENLKALFRRGTDQSRS